MPIRTGTGGVGWMMKIELPVLLASIVVIAGIFAFIPIDKATTVHTTIQGTQLNNVASTFQPNLDANATATCAGGDFLVHYIFSNSSVNGGFTQLGIQDLNSASSSDLDIAITLFVGNQTSISGTIGATADETITFFGNSTGSVNAGQSSQEDTGDLALTVVCQSGQEPTLTPTPP